MGSGCSAPKDKQDEPKKEEKKDDPLDGKIVNVAKGDGEFRDLENKQRLWDVEWESSQVMPNEGKTQVALRAVRGKLYTKNKVTTLFEADGARIDQEQNLLILKGNVKLTSLGVSKAPKLPSASGDEKGFEAPPGTLTCEQVRYEAKVKGQEIIKARGNVLVQTTQGAIGPTPELWANSELTVIATPNLYEMK